MKIAAPIALIAAMMLAGRSVAAIDQSVLALQKERVEVAARASKAALAIFDPSGTGMGSGVVISADGYALTNFHVVQPIGHWLRCGMNDGKMYDAVLVGIDATGDVALIKLFGRDDFPHAPWGDSDKVRAGDWVYVIGNPFALADDFQPTVTYGIVSGVHRYQYPAGTILEYADCIQTDAAINPGNSGGPLFNSAGELIGINGRGSFEKRGRVNVGVGYAISSNQIRKFMGGLQAGRIVDHATLGAVVANDNRGRAVVSDILEYSDAYRRGLRLDDAIVQFGDRRIGNTNEFKNALGTYPQGWRVPLKFERDGKEQEILVRLAGVHSPGELSAAMQDGEMPKEGNPPGDEPIPGRGRGRGRGRGEAKQPARREPPNIVKEHYESRRGYANFYFNRLHSRRLWTRHHEKADASSWTRPWRIAGDSDRHGKFEFTIADAQATAQVPSGRLDLDLAKPAEAISRDLPESGGLLTALSFWRRLLLRGPEKFGDLEYLGSMPLAERMPLVDALLGTYGEVDTLLYFDPDQGRLAAMEVFADDVSDPCEIYFGDFRPVNGVLLPHRMEVRFQDKVYDVMRIAAFGQTEIPSPPPVNNAAGGGT